MALQAPEPKPRAARDWRLAAVSACCTTLGCACLLLAACSASPVRSPVAPILQPLPAELTPIHVDTPPAYPPLSAAAPIRAPWPRLRARAAMPGCDYSPMVQRFASQMAVSPRHLHAALKQAMPFLLVVTDQIEKYDMPGEFAFLPWVESSYTMIPPNGDGVAGMWQLMPQTAREAGLRVDAEYDGRLDVYASTRTALALLKQYKEEFGDWRLANMAFNAGENSVKAALGNRRSITPLEIAKLRLNQTNYEHLTKLLALSCIVAAPERYRVELPEPDADDVPAMLELPAPVDLRLVAAISGLDIEQVRRWNPAYLKSRMPERGPFHLLIPAAQRAAIERTLGMLPQYAWRDWREMKLQRAQSIDVLGMAYDIDTKALAAINQVDPTATLPAGQRLLLPGSVSNGSPVAGVEPAAAGETVARSQSTTAPGTCTVHAGDTLWDIARRYSVRLEDLVQWNRLPRDSTLRLGQRLLLSPQSDLARH